MTVAGNKNDRQLNLSCHCEELELVFPTLDFITEEAFFKEACQTLPRMKLFFVDKLKSKPLQFGEKPSCQTYQWGPTRIVSGRINPETIQAGSLAGNTCFRSMLERTALSSESGQHQQRVIQTLINGISCHFNDLMMGIWGNTSLIRLLLNPAHTAYARVLQMEKVIQEGVHLIHSILGYLGAPWSADKAIRLTLLIHQLGCYLPEDYDQENLSGRLFMDTPLGQPKFIASGTAHIIRLLLKGIDTFRRHVFLDTLDNPTIQQRIGMIAALVKKGEMITTQLLCYAGEVPLERKRVRLEPIFNRQYRRARQRFHRLRIYKTMTPCLPRLYIDRQNIEWVMAQLIENAAKAMPTAGQLTLSLKPLYVEEPLERCGVHSSNDYLVLGVEDDGPGMSADQQLRIFDPFYANPSHRKTLGLGLAVAKGIIRDHGGYIQVQSKQGEGSRFKVYLPL